MLNLMLPGAGLIYLGRRRSGLVVAGLFLICFTAGVGWFLIAYVRYLGMAFSDDLMKGDTLEQLGRVFPTTGLLLLAAAALGLQVVAAVLLQSALRESHG